MSGAEHLGRVERHGAEHHSADDGAKYPRGYEGAEGALDQRGRAHRAHAERRRHQPEPDQSHIVNRIQRRDLRRADHIGRPDDGFGGQHRDQRRGEDRHDIGERIGADDELEGVEGAGQRRAERRRDGAAGAAADQHAQILPAQMRHHAETGGDAGADLGVASLEPDRGAGSVR